MSFFPKGNWVDLDGNNTIIRVEEENGKLVALNASYYTIKKHLRPGYLIPRQGHSNHSISPIMNTNEIPHHPTEILINRENRYASGRVFFDRGNLTDDIKNNVSSYYEFIVNNNTIQKRSLLGSEPQSPSTN